MIKYAKNNKKSGHIDALLSLNMYKCIFEKGIKEEVIRCNGELDMGVN